MTAQTGQKQLGQAQNAHDSVLEMFKAVLNRPDYTEEDSFLHAGGSSIKAARLIAQLRRTTGVSVPFALMTGARTVYHVSRFVEKAQAGR